MILDFGFWILDLTAHERFLIQNLESCSRGRVKMVLDFGLPTRDETPNPKSKIQNLKSLQLPCDRQISDLPVVSQKKRFADDDREHRIALERHVQLLIARGAEAAA